jgi:hypothetical protein
MAKITQHIPTFCIGISKIVEYKDINDLLNIDFVKAFKQPNKFPFWRYSISKSFGQILLMAEYKDDKRYKYYLVGYLSECIGIGELSIFTGNREG